MNRIEAMIDKYIDAEKSLAESLRWSDVHWSDECQNLVGIRPDKPAPDDGGRYLVPHWTRSNASAFELMVEHGCYPTEGKHNESELIWIFADLRCLAEANVGDHPGKEAAVRFAIVRAVIANLESGIKVPLPIMKWSMP